MRLPSLLLILLLLATPALATPRQCRIPLQDGRIPVADLTTQLQHHLHLPVTFSFPTYIKDIDLHTLKGSLFLTAINESLPNSAHITLSDDALLLTVDAADLPRSQNAVKKSIRTFVATLAPNATAAQRRSFDLSLPAHLDPARRLVVLVHGLDSDRSNWTPLAILLQNAGYQVAFFTYPSDQPVADSADSFTEQMRALRESFPTLPTSILAHSMGALVARAYVEGPSYAGGIDHFILLAPPNHGSALARYRFLLEIQEHASLARHNPDWRPSWIVTDGLGEAGADLKPHSPFLDALNSLPRRDGVKYTVIAGSQSPAYPLTAQALSTTSRLLPARLRSLPGLRQAYASTQRTASRLSHQTGHSDGTVSLRSTRLAGVTDYITLPTDHMTLQTGTASTPPPSWDTIQDRLTQ